MAGDWFPMGLWKSRSPEVVAIAASTGRTRHESVGVLLDLWSWASSESVDGRLRGVRLCHLPEILGADLRFWEAVRDVNWLAEDDHGIVIPGWETWLSESAKKRHRERVKKRVQRSARRPKVSPKCPEVVPKVSPKCPPVCPQNVPSTGQYMYSSSPTEKKNTEAAIAASCPEPAEPASGPPVAAAKPPEVVLTFPTVGTGPRSWDLTAPKLAEYREAYPGVDVLAECRKALQWCRDNPSRRKTAGGMPKFLAGWLGRAQDRGGPAAAKSKGEVQDDYFARQAMDCLPGLGDQP